MSSSYDLLMSLAQESGPREQKTAPEEPEGFVDDLVSKYLNFQEETAGSLVRGGTRFIVNSGRLFGNPTFDEDEEDFDIERLLGSIAPQSDSSLQKGIEKAAETGLGLAPFTGGAGAVAPALETGVVSAFGNALGLPPGLQAVFETLPTIRPRPSPVTARDPQTAKAIEFGRERGLSEKQLAALSNEDTPLKGVAIKLARRGKKTERLLESTKESLDGIAASLESHPETATQLDAVAANKTVNEMFKVVDKLKAGPDKEGAIEDINAFISGPQTAGDAVKLWRKINQRAASAKDLSLISKVPLKNILEESSPALAEELVLSNKLYSKYYDISEKLGRTTQTDWVAYGPRALMAWGFMTGNPFILKGAIGAELGQRLATEMLINPKLNSLAQRMSTAIKNGNISTLERTMDLLGNEVGKIDPALKDEFDQMDEQALIDAYRNAIRENEGKKK